MFRPPYQRLKRVLFTAAALLVDYIGSYALNSHCGGYWLKPQPGGRYRWTGSLSLITAIYWMPRFGEYWKDEPVDLIAELYAPLLRLDRTWFHPKRDMADADFNEWLRTAPLSQIHPQFRAEVAEARDRWATR